MNIDINLLATVAVIGVVGFVAFNASAREAVRIWINKLVKGSTTPLEKQKDRYEQLVKLSKVQRDSVATSIAKAVTANKQLTTLQLGAEAAKDKALKAVQLGMSEADQQSLALAWKDAGKKVEDQKARVAEFQKSADQARESLAETARLLEEFKGRIETNEGKVELMEALKVQRQVQDQLDEIKKGLGGMSDVDKEIDEALEAERAKIELGKGDGADKRLEDELNKQKGKDALDELKNGGKK